VKGEKPKAEKAETGRSWKGVRFGDWGTRSATAATAEGSSRTSRVDFARFVEIASGSLFEVVSQSTISLRRKLLEQNKYDQIYAAAEKQSKMLSGLRKSLVEA